MSRLEDSPIIFFHHILSRYFCAFLLQLQLVGFALELSPHKSVFTSTGMYSLKKKIEQNTFLRHPSAVFEGDI